MKKFEFSYLLIALLLFSSCSVVKNPQSSNFQRVKYNSHLKMAKKQIKKELEEFSMADLEKMQPQEGKLEPSPKNQHAIYAYNKVMTEDEKKDEVKMTQLSASREFSVPLIHADRNVLWNPIQGFKTIKPEAVNVPAVTMDDGDWGSLLYILVVVLLALLILSILLDLTGGLIGLLIAVILVLVILRLLGKV